MKRQEGLQLRARVLRSQGYSYTEIADRIAVSKSSVSIWCRNITLSDTQRHHLIDLALQGAARGREHSRQLRKIHKALLLTTIKEQAKKEVGRLSRRDRFMAGVMLYAGEGDRAGERVGVSNTNPQLLLFAMDWLCEFLHLDRADSIVHLYLHVGLNEEKAKDFWSETLRITRHQITYVYRPVPRPSHKGNIHQFGVCSVRFHNKMAHRRIMGWIQAVLNNTN